MPNTRNPGDFGECSRPECSTAPRRILSFDAFRSLRLASPSRIPLSVAWSELFAILIDSFTLGSCDGVKFR